MSETPDWVAALEATWPPAGLVTAGCWTQRIGEGGGSRVSAASLAPGAAPDGLPLVEALARALGQTPLMRVTAAESALDAALAARGYAILDPVALFAAPVARIAAVAADVVWPPGPAECAFWAAAGIGPARIAVMARTAGPRAVLSRRDGGGIRALAFVAAAGPVACLHALEVAPEARRQGHGAAMLGAAAAWARGQGADWLALAVTRANVAARALYAGAGMVEVGDYHYRRLPEPGR